MPATFPDLSGTEATRDTLHAYSRVLGAIRRAHAPPHPRWWHVSLRIAGRGLVTPPIPWPGGGDRTFAISLDLHDHRLAVEADGRRLPGPDLRDGMSATALGDRMVHILRDAGVDARPDRENYADEAVRRYAPESAARWLSAFQAAAGVLDGVRERPAGECGPVQLWPHHFDLAFEWIGSRRVDYVEDGEQRTGTSQIGFGFSGPPSGDGGPWPYFYATPWPFDSDFTRIPLPAGGTWVTEGWQGASLPYASARDRGQDAVREFCRAVYEGTASRLT